MLNETHYTEFVTIYFQGDESCSTQLIDGDGNFNVEGVAKFMEQVKLAECGLSYAVVSIMGPQSSGMWIHCLSIRTCKFLGYMR